MSVLESDIIAYGAATMPDDDTTQNIGGAISSSTGLRRVVFSDIAANGNMQVVSSASGDTTQTVTVHGRDAAGIAINETKTLNGQTPVAMTTNTTWERLRKALKSATTTGDVAVEAVTATATGTAQAGAAATSSAMASITLAAGASSTDDIYKDQVLRITSGTGAGQIRRIIRYNGTTKIASVQAWGTTPDNTSVYRISTGMVFEKSPAEVFEVRRVFYDAVADPAVTKTYYEKIFIKNTHGSLALTAAQILEQADPSGKITFALETTLDGTGTNGAGNNRQVAPSAGIGTFDSAAKNVANSQNHTAGAAQGVWLKLSLAAGDAATKTSYTPRESGSTT